MTFGPALPKGGRAEFWAEEISNEKGDDGAEGDPPRESDEGKPVRAREWR